MILEDVLRRGGVVTESVVLLDCRPFHDPCSCYHTGYHPDIVGNIVRAAEGPTCSCRGGFQGFLQGLRRQLEDALRRGRGEGHKDLVLFCYCAKGRHRSVAMAMICQHLLQATQGGVRCMSMAHTSLEFHRTRGCNFCHTECLRKSPARDTSLAQARALWRQVLAS